MFGFTGLEKRESQPIIPDGDKYNLECLECGAKETKTFFEITIHSISAGLPHDYQCAVCGHKMIILLRAAWIGYAHCIIRDA